MARIRTIKPEFWSSSKVGKVSRDARLLFLGLLNEADDEGRLIGQVKRLAGIVFPYDEDMDAAQVSMLLNELERIGLIVKYVVDDASYISIVGFSEHQKIDRRTPSRLPEPNKNNAQRGLVEESGEPADKKVLEQGTGNREQGTGIYSLSCASESFESPKGCESISAPVSFAQQKAGFDSKAFGVAWARWETHLGEQFKSLTPTAAESQLMALARFREPEAIEVVEYSISRGAKNLILNGDHKPRPQNVSVGGSRFAKPKATITTIADSYQ